MPSYCVPRALRVMLLPCSTFLPRFTTLKKPLMACDVQPTLPFALLSFDGHNPAVSLARTVSYLLKTEHGAPVVCKHVSVV